MMEAFAFELSTHTTPKSRVSEFEHERNSKRRSANPDAFCNCSIATIAALRLARAAAHHPMLPVPVEATQPKLGGVDHLGD